ncbi:hypothetical protein OUZ56_014543 [Daphnia magna]|uniref:Uncharacterized protein n=1 Tax=Daphnia magna TaxID=35525 RepID=A0ABR0AK37_9CRUS|nr:hypothetical protein OUZ56_014543 [Daphnia magna]
MCPIRLVSHQKKNASCLKTHVCAKTLDIYLQIESKVQCCMIAQEHTHDKEARRVYVKREENVSLPTIGSMHRNGA